MKVLEDKKKKYNKTLKAEIEATVVIGSFSSEKNKDVFNNSDIPLLNIRQLKTLYKWTNGVAAPSALKKNALVREWKRSKDNEASANVIEWTAADEILLEESKNETVELYETEVGRQVDGLCVGAVSALQGKTEDEIRKYQSSDTFESLRKLFSKNNSTGNAKDDINGKIYSL